MAALTVYANPDSKSRKAIPFLLDIQNDLLSSLETRVVVPLYLKTSTSLQPISRLTPIVTFQNKTLIAMVPELAGIARRNLGAPAGELPGLRSEIIASLDLLFTGF
jgi:toxin CcdB